MDKIDLLITFVSKFKVLYVEDDKQTQKATLGFLNEFFEDITLAEDGEKGLEVFNKTAFDLIITDINMPNINGIEMIENIRFDNDTTPIIVLSAHNETNYFMDCIQLGVEGFLLKPIEIDPFVAALEKIIEIHQLRKAQKTSSDLFKQYQNVVDAAAIVSKADPQGNITFANDKFCQLSGYPMNELLGKNHNIIRHPDMPSAVFKEMWHTIKTLKKTWNGKVKNRKKDGSHYWVDTVIKPIVDFDGNIVEFIGIRNDITEIENNKAVLSHELKNTTKSLNKSEHYTHQYEEANNQFTAILKTDTKNIITFANTVFCELSGYLLEELVGMKYQSLRDKSHIKRGDCIKLQKSMERKEHISHVFTNVAKDGSNYFIDTIVYPITNTHEAVVEHLHMMHDVTELTNLHAEMEATQKEIVYKMGEIGESRSQETGNHVKRVANYSKILAELYGLEPFECKTLFTASPMHDIGKVAIADAILKKPGKLTQDEFEIMKTHAEIGEHVLKGSTRAVLNAASIVAGQHHEKWNGKGYPRGLKAEEIHIYGRITALVDVFDALGSNRCYKKAWEDEKIFQLLKDNRGEHFEPKLVDLFLENKEQFLAIREEYKD